MNLKDYDNFKKSRKASEVTSIKFVDFSITRLKF